MFCIARGKGDEGIEEGIEVEESNVNLNGSQFF